MTSREITVLTLRKFRNAGLEITVHL